MPELELTPADIAGMDPQEFARLVAQTPKQTIAELMAGDLRRPILDEVFAQMAGRYQPERAGGLTAVIRWRIGGRPDGGDDEYELDIAGDTCTLRAPTDAEPRLVIETDGVTLLRLASGNASGPALFMTRKLKLHGDLALGAGLTRLFDIPRP